MQESRACFGRASDKRLLASVAHIIQEGAGTGVCVGENEVLTCAHCVCADDDPDDDDEHYVQVHHTHSKPPTPQLDFSTLLSPPA
jgi:hypothetical protein